VIPLHVPDLKDRAEDIAPLAYHFIRIFNRDGYRVEGLRHDSLDLLESYPWPGNVRELENVMERAVILRKAGLIQPRDLPENLVGAAEAGSTPSLDELERETILRALAQHDGNRTKVARLLGINRRTLYRKLLRYGVSDEPEE
jgi:DNA-binding NtrC family response regulator